ncbi:uncharacterized protein LOC143185919 [Calliopsis andreniformis]|uniref:uncharacterized protein LOC143185919 n=1 Tax=Calliopsis andreniformis TaxID=337506 RepID=UPI003FCD8CE3
MLVKDVCHRSRCPGPLRYYEDLGCAPVYRNPADCCAKRYDCSHLENVSKMKCHVNEHEYSVGERLRDEDRNPCDKDCFEEQRDAEMTGFLWEVPGLIVTCARQIMVAWDLDVISLKFFSDYGFHSLSLFALLSTGGILFLCTTLYSSVLHTHNTARTSVRVHSDGGKVEEIDLLDSTRVDSSHLSSKEVLQELRVLTLQIEYYFRKLHLQRFKLLKFTNSASFVCAQINCTLIDERPPPNCYIKFSHDECCPKLICLKEGEERATCEVDGRIYKDGEYFRSKSDLEKDCYCISGYRDQNLELFCKKPSHNYCAPLFMNATAVYHNCAPAFHVDQNPQRDCSSNFACYNTNDIVIRNPFTAKLIFNIGKDKSCRFGDMSMYIGDEVYQAHNFDCTICACEVPPVPTCQRRPVKECDIVKYLSP